MNVLLQEQGSWLDEYANAHTTNEVAIEFSRKREHERSTSSTRTLVRQVCECNK